MTASAVAAPPGRSSRRRFRDWWLARTPRSDTLLLTQRNVYILPTRAGLLFGLTLVVLLLASINYQLNLGYLLTFVLAGAGIASMHQTHATLRGLTLHLQPVAATHAGEAALLPVVLTTPGAARFGIGLRLQAAPASTFTWIDVPAGGQATAHLSFAPPARGLHAVPALVAETRFPLGLFRAWAYWRPAVQVLAYPRPEDPPPPLPAQSATPGGPALARPGQGAEFDGIRAYRRGDAPKLVVWKKAARALEGGGELVSREASGSAQAQLWLAWDQCGALAGEARLSRLAAWVLAANRAGVDFGLRLPGVELAPAQGDTHRRSCLEALALWR
ncbi:MAG TPA: DUF58 domain-containing protein [Burkholderiaceae bacterium]|nr:DUF58 domain-containing protein [Burkholderiaceae bacterium]